MKDVLMKHIDKITKEELKLTSNEKVWDYLSPFYATYTEELKYEMAKKVEKLLAEYKDRINKWEYVFDWRVYVNARRLGLAYNTKETLGEILEDFMKNLNENKKFDLNIENFTDRKSVV